MMRNFVIFGSARYLSILLRGDRRLTRNNSQSLTQGSKSPILSPTELRNPIMEFLLDRMIETDLNSTTAHQKSVAYLVGIQSVPTVSHEDAGIIVNRLSTSTANAKPAVVKDSLWPSEALQKTQETLNCDYQNHLPMSAIN